MLGKLIKTRTRVLGDDSVVDLIGRTEDGEKFALTVDDPKPYFYIDGEPEDDDRITGVELSGIDFITGDPLTKVYTKFPSDVGKMCTKYEKHWEADIRFNDRIRYDNGWKGTIIIPDVTGYFPMRVITPSEPADIKPRVCYCDIETLDDGPMATGDNPYQPIVSIALWDSYKDKYLAITSKPFDKEETLKIFKNTYGEDIDVIAKVVDSEYQILEVFRAYLEKAKPDIITGWYFVDFDWKYIMGRCEKLNIDLEDSHLQIFDLLQGFKSLSVRATAKGKQHAKNLDYVGKELIGKGKIDRTKIHEMWNGNHIERLIAYNLGDVYLTKEIDKVKCIIEHYMMVCEVAGCSLDDVFYPSKIIDSVIFHRLRGTNIILPSKGMLHAEGIDKGATVNKASKGVLDWVGVVDNKQEYPSIIRTLNTSPETKVDENYKGPVNIAPSGRRYKKSPMGLIPRILTELLEIRVAIKKQMKEFVALDPKNKETQEWKSMDNRQEAFKYTINSFYGVMGSVDKKNKRARWRLADGDIGSDVTKVGREHIDWNAEIIEQRGHSLKYGDTDSSMFQFFPGEEKTYEEMVEELNECIKHMNSTFDKFALQYNCETHYFEVEAKCIYEKFFQAGTKKRYAGLVSWYEGIDTRDWPLEDRMEIVGMDIIRTDKKVLTQTIQKTIVTMALTGEESKIRSYIMDMYQRAKNGEFDIELGTPGGWNKTLEQYKKPPKQVEAALWSNRNLGKNFVQGDKPIYWYVKGVKGAEERTLVAALEWGDDPNDYGFILDYEVLLQKTFLTESMESIYDALGIKWAEIISGMEEQSLDKYW